MSIQPIGGGVGILVDADGVPVVGDDGMPILRSMDAPGTGSGSAPAYSGTAAGIEHQARLAAAENVRQRDWQQKQNRLTEQNRIREARLDVARSLAETATLAAQRSQEQAVDIAPYSPMRFTALLRGQPMRAGAKTPYDIFKGQLVSQAQQKIPSLTGEEDIATLDNLIAKLQGAQEVPQRPIGFKQGSPGAGIAVPVGEEGMEILRLGPRALSLLEEGEIQVMPLAPGAAGGLPYDLGGFENLFQGLRKSVGAPETLTHYLPRYGPLTGMNRTWRSRMGIETGKQPSGPSATPRPFQALGDTIGIRGGLLKMGMPFQEAARMANLIGLLPALHKAAPFIQSLDPAEQGIIQEAYALAMGMGPESFEAGITKPLVRGGPLEAVTGLR